MKKRLLIAALIATAVLIFAVLPRTQYGHPDPVGPTIYSKSATGHAAFYELLQSMDVAVATSEAGSGGFVAPNDLLVVAEPAAGPTLEDVKAMLVADNVLLVLPKRTGTADRKRPNWLGRTRLVAPETTLEVLHLVDDKATITRGGSLDHWSLDPFAPGHLSISGAQLIHSTNLVALIAGPEGILVGYRYFGKRRVTVLADPDLFANFALTRGDNAVAAVNLILHLRKAESSQVIFDEFEHGFAERPFHMLGVLFQFPFALVTMQMAVAVGLLSWAATARFGSPASPGAAREAGKRSLIEAGARLLDNPARTPEISTRYVEAMLRAAGPNSCAAPELAAATTAALALGNAQRIFVWKKELNS